MKISKSEKMLMVILLAVLIVGGYYKFINTKQIKSVEVLRSDKEKYSDKLENIKLSIAMSNKREKDVKILNSKIQDKTKDIYPVIQQERLIIELDALLKKSNVVGSFSFQATNASDSTTAGTASTTTTTTTTGTSNTTSTSSNSSDMGRSAKGTKELQSIVDKYNNIIFSEGDNGNKTTLTNYKNDIKGSTQYTQAAFTFKGSYNNINTLIKNIENNSRKILISDLTLTGGTTGEISGTANLSFYSVPKFVGMDANYFKWNYSNIYGKQNPFASNGVK